MITKCKNAILDISQAMIILKSTNICANHFPLVFLYVAYIKTSECVKFQCNKKIQGSLGLVGGEIGGGGGVGRVTDAEKPRGFAEKG